MNKTKNSGKQIMLYVILCCLLAIVVVYFLVYKKYDDKAKNIKNSLPALEEKVVTLKNYYDNEQNYIDEMERMKDEILDITNSYEPKLREENFLMLAVKSLDNAEIDYTNVNFSKAEALATIDSNLVTAAEIEELNTTLIFVDNTCSYVNKCDYPNLRSMISTFLTNDGRNTIKNISYSKNEADNVLEGTVEYTSYSLIGNGKEYTPVAMEDYIAGLEDLFNLRKITEEASTEE